MWPYRLRCAAAVLAAGLLGAGCGGPLAAGPAPTRPTIPASLTGTPTGSNAPPASNTPLAGSNAPPSPAAGPIGCAKTRLAAMATRTRIGQLFLLGVPATGLAASRTVITRSAPGGVFLTGRSTTGVAATAAVTTAAQQVGTAASGGVGMFVAADQEGGKVQVLSGPGFSDMPSASVQGGWSATRLQAAAATWGRELRAAGVNVDLAPVADTLSATLGTANAPIGRYGRAFGTDPGTVSAAVTAFVHGMSQAGVTSVVKHFPGLGRVRGNTDYSSGVTDSRTSRTDADLAPFRDGVDAGAGWLMVSSAVYSEIDPGRPAVFSPTVLQAMVRQGLGFSGLVVSDDLGNAAQVAAVPPGARAVDFLAAGGDVVLTANPATLSAMVDSLAAAVAGDPRLAARVADSELRILSAKAALGLVRCDPAMR